MTYREAGDDQPTGTPVTCEGCGHVFVPTSLAFTVDDGDGGGISFALPAGEAACPQCGAPTG